MSTARLASLSSNPTLKEYTQGAAKQAIAKVAEFIAPTVPVAKAKGQFKRWNDKTALVIPDTRRAIKGEATQVGFEMSDAQYNCLPHALDFPVDIEEQDEADDLMNLVQEGADIVAQLAGMSHEKTVVDLANSGATAGTALDSTNSALDLVDTIDQQIINVIKGTKGWGTNLELCLLFGPSALRKIKNHASVKDRFKMGSKKDIVNPTVEDLLELFITKCSQQVSWLVTDANKNLDAASIDFIFDSKVLVFARSANPTRFDPSFMKTFRKRGAYMTPRFYQRPDGRVEVAGFDWSEEVQLTNADASRLCSVT